MGKAYAWKPASRAAPRPVRQCSKHPRFAGTLDRPHSIPSDEEDLVPTPGHTRDDARRHKPDRGRHVRRTGAHRTRPERKITAGRGAERERRREAHHRPTIEDQAAP